MVTVNSDRFEFRRGHLKEYVSREAIKSQQIEPGSGGIIVEKPNLDTPGGGKALEVYLSTGATSATARSALDLNLRCLMALHACTKLCEVIPFGATTLIKGNLLFHRRVNKFYDQIYPIRVC